MPVEGRVPTAPVEGWAPPEPQPRASLVLAEAPLVRIRFWSGCHFCAGCWLGRFPCPGGWLGLFPPPETFPGLFTLAFRLALMFWL